MRIIITGDFTTDDLKIFARILRTIEQRNPEKTYGLFLETPDLTIEEAKKLVSKIYASTLKKKKKKSCKHLEELVKGILYCKKYMKHGISQFSLGCDKCKDREKK